MGALTILTWGNIVSPQTGVIAMSIEIIVLTLLFLCWGSFLNVLGYRLITGQPILWARSECPSCGATIAPYDLIPLFSYVILRGRCRCCHQPISSLYPLIEFLTAFVCLVLFFISPAQYFPLFFLFFSALIVTIRSDLETMLISRYVTTYLVPVALLGAYGNLLPISPIESISGWLLGWIFMKTVQYGFKKVTNKDGLGDGDVDLIAMIGAFTGPIGCWMSLLIGSILGTLSALFLYAFSSMTPDRKMPFGPFLALGAIVWVIVCLSEQYFFYLSTL